MTFLLWNKVKRIPKCLSELQGISFSTATERVSENGRALLAAVPEEKFVSIYFALAANPQESKRCAGASQQRLRQMMYFCPGCFDL
jgi:hypothetical protein